MDRIVSIFDDLFDISARLKSIDDGYYIVYDKARSKYEVHNSKRGESLQLVLPFEALDARTVQYVQMTRIENIDRIAKEIDIHNERLDRQKSAAILDEAQYKTKQITEYLSSGGAEVPPYDSI